MTEILNKNDTSKINEYEDFVKNHPNGNFMQSIHWTGVKCDWDYEAVVVRNDEDIIIASALILIRKIPLLNKAFLYSPHGPICDYRNINQISQIMSGVEIIRKKYKAYQIIFDPCIMENDENEINVLINAGFSFKKNAPELSTIQARNNYMLKIDGRNKDEIFNSFHKKWRYNIRVAERKGVQCRVCGKESLDDFYILMKETGERDGFCIRSREYFERMLDCLGEHCRLYMCYYEGLPVSGAITTQYAGKTCYVYGASTSKCRNVMPNYMMQWNMISWAVDSGCWLYDFQGIPFYKDEAHPNYGVYRFKKGFNGDVMTYAGEFEISYKRITKYLVKLTGYVYRKLLRKNPSELLTNSFGKKKSKCRKHKETSNSSEADGAIRENLLIVLNQDLK